MPNVSPTAIFWLSFVVTVGIGVTTGSVHLAHIVPAAWMDSVDAYIELGVFLGSTFLTMATGAGMSKQSMLASVAALPEVKNIVTTQPLADATPSEKVVSSVKP